MIGTKLIAATVAGAAVGVGTFALAPTQAAPGSSAASASSTTASASSARHKAIARHKNLIHGSWVTRDRVHHEAIRGVVRSVSASAITVRAVDGYTQTYSVNSDTKVRVRRDGDKGLDTIGDVKVGDQALVAGVGNDQAKHVIARQPKAATSS